MDQLLQAFGDAIGQFFNSPLVRAALFVIGVYIAIVWVAAAYWAYRDLQSRTSNPLAPYFAAILIIVFTPVFFPFGLLLYRILRPSETLAEASERALAEEAMLVEIEAQPHCANCGRQVHSEWIICPTCRNRLRRVCPNCSRLTELDWSLCAWCGKDFERPELLRDTDLPRRRPAASPAPALAHNQPADAATRPAITGGVMEPLAADGAAGRQAGRAQP